MKKSRIRFEAVIGETYCVTVKAYTIPCEIIKLDRKCVEIKLLSTTLVVTQF